MRRVLIVGSGGAGKSTLARRVGAAAGLPVVHLDAHYWGAGWVPTPAEAWRQRVAALAAAERWVMDGNYSGTFDLRLPRADTVVFLDLPRRLCLARVVRRRLRYLGRTRPDMGAGCPERLDWEFVRWIWTYPRRRRPAVLARLAALPPHVRIVTLHSAAEVDAFVQSLGET